MSIKALNNEELVDVMNMYWNGQLAMSKELRDKYYHMGITDYGRVDKDDIDVYYFCTLSFTGLWLAYILNKKMGLKNDKDWQDLTDLELDSIKIN